MKLKIIIILITICFISCKKANHKCHAMVGEWTSNTGGTSYNRIIIYSNGRGTFTHVESSYSSIGFSSLPSVGFGSNKKTIHAWLIIEDWLHFKRRDAIVFKINEYPSIATQELTKNGNTINPGETYMQLDGMLYKKTE